MKNLLKHFPTKRLVGVLLACLLLKLSSAQAQVEMAGANETSVPYFYLDLASFRSDRPHENRLEIYLKIMYDELQFVKVAADSYQAIYEVSAVILDEDDFQVNGKIWRDTVTVNDFASTNSRQKFHFTQAAFVLAPGKYRVNIGVMDNDTRLTSFRKTSIVLRDFGTSKLSLSDVLIADAVSADSSSGKIIIHPQVTAPRREKSQLFAFFEIYDASKTKEYKVSYFLKNTKGDKVLRKEQMVRHAGEVTPVVLELPNETLAHGVYLIHIEVTGNKQQATTEREITLHWVGIPSNIVDLDAAIEQLRYIAKRDAMKKILAVPPEKRREAFLSFWKENDPTPGTEVNELMDEYYRRVNYANTHFRGFREGWKSDMGMVYIIFGPPNDIERNPFNRSANLFPGRTIKAYEIWSYYDLNRQFIFIDETGYDEFRLAYPFNVDQYLR
ncbi:MAG: GWxTD domain-containing protein [candidate division KSB1 bacterium]|nr:GWxTD domain-containing protein [candidate division KSB1 bacterium]MDZ7303557.1 GWxTD domain-containing protein [candidate division KSB1 bacterium]MDZ7312800.1 GWxTD domain-containing protein [candidate division KSB1 bacterium]